MQLYQENETNFSNNNIQQMIQNSLGILYLSLNKSKKKHDSHQEKNWKISYYSGNQTSCYIYSNSWKSL